MSIRDKTISVISAVLIQIYLMVYGASGRIRKQGLAAIFLVFAGFPAFAQPITIAAFGDSLIQGHGLPRQDGFVPQLQRWLEKQGRDVNILNAGVSGDSTAGGLARVAWSLTPDVDAMIVNLGGNDLLRGIPPETARANIAGILEYAAQSNLPVLLVGLSAPGNYGADYQTRFNAIFPDLAAQFGTLLYKNYLAALTEPDAKSPDLKYFQTDNIHPNATGVSLIVKDIGPSVIELIDRAKTAK